MSSNLQSIHNLTTDAQCLTRMGTWNGAYEIAADGVHYSYYMADGQSNATVYLTPSSILTGQIIVMAYTQTRAATGRFEYATQLWRGECNDMVVQACRMTDSKRPTINLANYGTVTLYGRMILNSEDEWNQVFSLYESGQLSTPLFDETTLPLLSGGVGCSFRAHHVVTSMDWRLAA